MEIPKVVWEHNRFRVVRTNEDKYTVEHKTRDAMGSSSWEKVQELNVNARKDTVSSELKREWMREMLSWAERRHDLELMASGPVSLEA